MARYTPTRPKHRRPMMAIPTYKEARGLTGCLYDQRVGRYRSLHAPGMHLLKRTINRFIEEISDPVRDTTRLNTLRAAINALPPDTPIETVAKVAAVGGYTPSYRFIPKDPETP